MSPRRARATRGRAGDDPAVALRQQLVDTAERLLAERQVGAITTREIARAAGVSDGVLYNYFADKYDLLVAALLRRYAGELATFERDLPAPGTGEVRANLVSYAEAVHKLIADTLPVVTGLMSEPTLLHRFMVEIHREPMGHHRLIGPLADYLTGERRLGRLGDFPLDATVTMIIGSAMMLGFAEVVGGVARGELARGVPDIIDTLLAGIAPG
ncbi:TetR/AcrR family transcriptional regulator [Plantactinospora siamensis]|uniref:TetR/AcrR family transcriptional regulator n=1 Tax=Plantactinospora siamensis TaxID=555372 RepID=A0ABV6P8L7_9ACTN